MNSGLFVVIEGSAGSGKTTQLNLLKERLRAVGHDAIVFDFPRYSHDSSYFIKRYLNGEYGASKRVSAYTASLFYALDRYEAAREIKSALNEGKIILASQYAGANMAQQGSKFLDDVERRSFFVWADNVEFQMLDIPRPNINFYLRVPADVAYEQKAKSHDENGDTETKKPNKDQLRKIVATYDLLCRLFPNDFRAIECTKDRELLSVAQINNRIWDQLKPLLPAQKSHASHSVVVTLDNEDKPSNNIVRSDKNILTHEFKDASLVLRLHLERLPHERIEPSFNGWTSGDYRVYSPDQLAKNVRMQYKETAEHLSILHNQLQQKLTTYFERQGEKNSNLISGLLRPVTPLAALSRLNLTIKKSDVTKVAGNLLAHDSHELQWAAKQLYLAARHNWPADFSQPLESNDSPLALSSMVSKLAGERLPQVFSSDESIKLLEAHPRLEFDLLAESIYPYSSLSLDEISEEVSDWPYSQKYLSLKETASQSEVLRKVTYKIDIVSDHITLNKAIEAANLKDIQVQAFTPRYGYDVPQIIEAAGADDIYDATFDESLKLYSNLQAAEREDLTPYATLLGHKVRWQLQASAADLRLVVQDKHLAAQPLIRALAEKLSEVHPLLWDIITSGQLTPKPAPRQGKARIKPAHQPTPKKKPRKSR
ncbi:deoxynucleoside kinase [Candidatus Saccharibacteria bacterium]|nr:deoxynucleoside kinase [Candidatus Saccharibacteria bacterium]